MTASYLERAKAAIAIRERPAPDPNVGTGDERNEVNELSPASALPHIPIHPLDADILRHFRAKHGDEDIERRVTRLEREAAATNPDRLALISLDAWRQIRAANRKESR